MLPPLLASPVSSPPSHMEAVTPGSCMLAGAHDATLTVCGKRIFRVDGQSHLGFQRWRAVLFDGKTRDS